MSKNQMTPRMNKEKALKIWNMLSKGIVSHQRVIRLVVLTGGLIGFLALLPPHIRITFWVGLQTHKILASMLLVFSLLAISLIWSTGQVIDTWAFLILNLKGSRPVWLDWVMLGFTQIGSGIFALGIALVMFFISDRRFSYMLILGTLSLWVVVEIIKFLAHRSRPYIQLIETRVVGYRAVGRSFPSGHTSQVFFMATLIAQYFHANLWVVSLLYTTALLVGITRMYVGAHYPRDVLAGAILGSAWGLLGVILDGYVLSNTL